MLARAGDQAACARAVATGLAEIDALRRAAYGEPEPFPADLDPAYLPAAVQARARRVPLECPELGWQLVDVDCSEFPCFTVWNTSAVTGDVGMDPKDCPAWAEVPRDDAVTLASNVWVGPDGERLSVQMVATYPPGWWEAHPPGQQDPERRKSRFDLRREIVLGDLQAELGARDLTKVEQLEEMVSSLREAGFDEEHVQKWIDRLEEARAAEAQAE
jgi:hypothetical protein